MFLKKVSIMYTYKMAGVTQDMANSCGTTQHIEKKWPFLQVNLNYVVNKTMK